MSVAPEHHALPGDLPELHLFIDGQWLAGDGRKTEPVLNPATEEVLGELPHATPADLDRALAAAQAAFAGWRALAPVRRGQVLRDAAALMRERSADLARIATLESGKPVQQTRIEVEMSAQIFEWYAEEGRRAYGRVLPRQAPGTRMTVVKEPVGPVAAFAPWNFPLGNPARKLGAPLAAGCPCILKPAEETPASALGIARALAEAGVPDGVVNIVFGVPAEVSSQLIASPVIRKISFTGSIAVGKQLMKLAAEGMKRTTMELGGHGPVIVCEDVDLEKVLDMCVAAKYRNCGQVCVSPTRFLVHESLYKAFVEGFARRAGALKIGNGLDESTQVGPLIHARRLADVTAFVEDARAAGATINAGGERIEGRGYFYRPTVVSSAPLGARIMNEEPFGPIAIINPFANLDEAIAEANRLPYGLAAFGFSKSASVTRALGDRLEAGMVGINTFQISVPESPFGGIKESGHGSEEGVEGLEACLVTRFISEA
ncbi:MAG: NAD-dependent succinate-semialdehyde dehydrogenase [Gammaproteobacteria bacterium]|nr:NAD-dependent succinate-semialdehyde dehydrogenase [Gammaproteobacteria bacterium]MDH4253311.1 NAD-dependent succinate-semialdehyde dehydrogenase [Gammaproteobacteria bacterium]MDH5309920.1 NAD-dependent succinate-semialdehyde dehydrogenase [Gammaproteobacteria bacterium]